LIEAQQTHRKSGRGKQSIDAVIWRLLTGRWFISKQWRRKVNLITDCI